MGLFDRESRLRRFEEEAKERAGRLEVLEAEVKMWPPARTKKLTERYMIGFGEGKPTSWPKAFVWEWKRAGGEEEQDAVFKKYVDRLTFSPQFGFTKETATRRLLSALAKEERGEEV